MGAALAATLWAYVCLLAGVASAKFGGPASTSYPYYYLDSAETGGPVYSFEDISASGTALAFRTYGSTNSNGDEGVATVPVPSDFNFTFFDRKLSTLSVSVNGLIYLGTTDPPPDHMPCNEFENVSSTDSYMIAAYHDDLLVAPSGSGVVYWKVTGSSPQRRLVIQWEKVVRWGYQADSLTFQIVLYETLGDIRFNYKDVAIAGAPDYTNGASALVGIEQTPDVYLVSSCNTKNTVANNSSVLFTTHWDDDKDGTDRRTDCNDADAAIYPGAPELCDNKDNDCDTKIDEDGTIHGTTWYKDVDSDGYGLSNSTVKACSRPAGYAAAGGDCNDSNAAINPGAVEVCNGVDDDCDGQRDEEGAVGSVPHWFDDDGDNYGGGEPNYYCTTNPEPGWTTFGGDCDDSNYGIYPNAVEPCDGIDNNCDGQIDNGNSGPTWYRDTDGDTYGVASNTSTACNRPTGYTDRPGDCNDGDATINPGRTEICNGKDDDCNNLVDDNVNAISWYPDGDSDTWPRYSESPTVSCTQPAGYAAPRTGPNGQLLWDCVDTDGAINPGATEKCNGKDDNCNSQIDEGLDADADGTPDCQDVCPSDKFNDIDGDNVCGNLDNCPTTSNVGQSDTDTDGVGDVCDFEDCDGVDNDGDSEIDEGYDDSDRDGVLDCLDACAEDADDDLDGDGFCADVDNCPDVPNPEQADADADGFGDDCDLCQDIPDEGQDSDGDGAGDACDNCPDRSNPGQEDEDADGLGNACESCDPGGPDSDTDGQPDACDLCPNDFDDGTDSDGDGLGDACDTCPGDAGAGADADGDGLGEVCDRCPSVADASNADSDGDGVGDACDSCEGEANAGRDSDRDGVDDACDVCPGGDDGADGDGDTYADSCDVCPATPDGDQSDSDGDGVGDACDVCPGESDANQADADKDGVGDACDVCPEVADPSQTDTDGDGTGDVCEEGPTTTEPVTDNPQTEPPTGEPTAEPEPTQTFQGGGCDCAEDNGSTANVSLYMMGALLWVSRRMRRRSPGA